MSQAVYAKVIKRLSNVYGAPNTADQESFYDEFCKALKGYSEALLEKAIDTVVKERTFPGWPVVGEVVEAVNRVARTNSGPPPEHVKFAREAETGKKYVDPARVKELTASFTGSLNSNNDFAAIVQRTPIGGQCDVSEPWGEEVTDRDGVIVPIRERRKNA